MPPSTIRTPLDKLDIDDKTRKQLEAGGIHDVEAILETDPKVLAKIVGSEDMAKKLIEMARRVLASTPPPPPAPPPSRTDLSALGVDAALQRKLRAAGFADVESVAAADPAKLARVVGDTATASKLIASAAKVLARRPAPAPKGTTKKTAAKQTAAKKAPRKSR